jgi:phosphonate transport system ATP-binding protein
MTILWRSHLWLVVVALLAGGCQGGNSDEALPTKNKIVIGLNPSERSENVQRNARTLARMISERSGLPTEIFVAQDYSGLVEALRGRSIDFAFFAPVSYVFAERIADARVLLKAERKGKPYYYGSIVVNSDSSYHTLADLKGRDIAWVDPTSASGYIFPKAALVERGIDTKTYFRQERFAGGHDAVLLAVINGTITAGATYCNDTLGENGSWTQLGDGAFKGKIRPIFFSAPIPGDNLATTQYMIDNYPEIVEKLKRAVQGLTDNEAGKALMQQMYHVDAMIPATSADYDPVRRAADLLKLDITGKISSGDSAAPGVNVAREEAHRRNTTISWIALVGGIALGIAALVIQTLRERRKRRSVVIARTDGTPPASAAGDMQFSMRNLSVIFQHPEDGNFTALDGIDLDIQAGEFIAIIGLSGAGKSTLLRSLNRTNQPSSGTILFEGKDITHVDGQTLIELRQHIGFIFQQFNLVKTLPVLSNVLTGTLARVPRLRALLGLFPRHEVDLARRYLHEVGLGEKINSRTDTLSGGQQQRVAIARALAQQPRVILADEPMASLDPKLSDVILQLLRRFNREERITVLVNLHVLELARKYADRIIALRKGKIAFDGRPEELTPEIVESIYHTEDEELHRM